jgi:hypothetical protein
LDGSFFGWAIQMMLVMVVVVVMTLLHILQGI